MRTCGNCYEKVEFLYRWPLVNVCGTCHMKFKAQWKSETPERKQEIRKNLRRMGLPSPDEM